MVIVFGGIFFPFLNTNGKGANVSPLRMIFAVGFWKVSFYF